MKREINLRTREFVIAREFYWPRLVITLALVLLVLLLLGGSVFVHLYKMRLVVDATTLSQDKRVLQKQVAPLVELEAKIDDLEKREQLAHSLEGEHRAWSGDFGAFYRLAEKEGLQLTAVAAAPGEIIILQGESKLMRPIINFEQSLARQQDGDASYRFIVFPSGDRFSFEIELNEGGDEGGDTDEDAGEDVDEGGEQ